MGASDEHIASGTVPQRSDSKRMLLVKEVNATVAAGGGGGGASNNKHGNGSPVGVVTPDYVGQIYWDDASIGEIDLWRSTGLTNADWVQVIS